MDPHDDPVIPDSLEDDLTALYRAEARVPAAVDRAVTAGARSHFARRTRWVRWAGAGAAVAAVLLVSVQLFRSDPAPSGSLQAARDRIQRDGDADGNDTVDIRDALALARKIEAGGATWTRWEDLNQDKVVDGKDVDAIARMAVSLNAGAVR